MLEMNKVFLIGNLTQDPDVRSLSSGTTVAEFGLAVNRRYKDKNGELREDVLFIQVESWARLAEFCGDYLKKGKRVFVEGRLKMDSWEAKDGTKRSRIKVRADRIQFADLRPAETSAGEPEPGGAYPGSQKPQAAQQKSARTPGTEQPSSTEDDLPF